jgi:hypothetical protein
MVFASFAVELKKDTFYEVDTIRNGGTNTTNTTKPRLQRNF